MSRHTADTPPIETASVRDLSREVARRAAARLRTLARPPRWTLMDAAFALMVLIMMLSSTGFFTAISATVMTDPDFFHRRVLAAVEASLVDPIETGAVEDDLGEAPAASEGEDGAMPAPSIRRAQAPRPADYEIVMLFDEEAVLATRNELWRVKRGSVLPGLGAVLSVDLAARTLHTEEATLRMVGP